MILDVRCDLLLYYSFWDNKNVHGVSGHMFEVLDYYWYLKHFIDVKCLFPGIKKEFLINILNRYNYNFNIDDFYFCSPTLIRSNLSLNVDGSYPFFNRNILLGKKLAFSCGSPIDKPRNSRPKDVLFLEDSRIYPVEQNSIHYTKKIAFDIIKKPDTYNNRTFAHITKNCKKTDIEPLIEKFPNLLVYSDYLPESYYVSNKPIKFGDFNKFVYTPVARKFDCSPRLIAECDYLGLEVLYYNIDYYDIGLEVRKQDILDKKVGLNLNDPLIDILRKV